MKQKSSFVCALGIAFIDNFGLSLVFILFAPLVLDPTYGLVSVSISQGTKYLLLGLLIGSFPLCTFVGAPFWGDIGDRFGRKKAFIWTLLGTIAGHLFSAYAIYLQNFIFLLLARMVAGFFSGNISICLATISDLSKEAKSRAFNFGALTVAMGIGWISAMLAGGLISDREVSAYFNPTFPFLIAAGFTLAGYFLIRYCFEETFLKKEVTHFHWLKSMHEIKEALHVKEIRPYLQALLLWSLGWFFTFQWFSPISLEKFQASQWTISCYLGILGICWVIGGVFINPYFVRKFASFPLTFYSVLLCAFFMFLAAFSSEYLIFSFFFWITAITAQISISNLLNLVSEAAPKEVQGKVMGFTQSLQAVASIVVPLVGGLLANFSISLIFPLSASLLFACFLVLLFTRRTTTS